ncbi:hypothetical protein ACWT_5877 [Actinoplanes sp. SE50]|uniref:hypothetical protein n=1 Tax=unclassified Actinoplanes TaxID=2626549 RepID=UPI00023EBDE1|nr:MULTISPECIES: hypothetical protein [unclassified Actinoplanes]AEV86895.1 hypothetical protein ACPL_6008 [Actinoplanes sp. SE50/110]ATO85292.1 hypothetical protein ACWT_5877 [Actinoplanes sp. SE50]SLM02702.1 hypothetical protein ACSP50_5984 [Actinoplanes sp. SE50/110]
MTDTAAVPLKDVVHVLRLARDGQLGGTNDWTTEGFVSAVWNGFITKDDTMGLTPAGEAFLGKVGVLFPEATR